MRAYIAGPLFNESERQFNLLVDRTVRALGLTTHLPQRDGPAFPPGTTAGLDEEAVRARIFAADVAAVRDSDVLVFVLDGRVPDEGACVELGMAYALSIPCFGLQTDCRRFDATGRNNLMVDHALTHGTAHTLDELTELLRAYLATKG